MISVSKIFKQAIAIMRTHKFLWAFGLFFVWDIIASYTYSGSGNGPMLSVNNNLTAVILAVVGLILTLLFLRAKAGLIFATKEILDKKTVDFSRSFHQAGKYYIQILKMILLIALSLLVAALVLFLPVVNLASQHLTNRAVVLGIIAGVIMLPLLILANFLNSLASIFIVTLGLGMRKSLEASLDLIKKFWGGLLWFSICLGFFSLLDVILFDWLWSQRVAFLSNLSYNLLGIGLFLLLLIFATFVSLFQEIAWVILFKQIVSTPKVEEEAVPVPEVI